MAWLKGIAAKTENLLNNLDQAAGQMITTGSPTQNVAEEKTNQSFHDSIPVSQSILQERSASISSSVSVPSNMNRLNGRSSSPYLSQTSKSSYASSLNNGSTRKKDKDEELFQFLNSTDDKKTKHSRQSSCSSTTSALSNKSNKTNTTNNENRRSETPTKSNEEVIPIVAGDEKADQQTHQFELENKLLKNEISSLNNEMNSLVKRVKTAEEESKKLQSQINQKNYELSKTDHSLRDLRAKETDFTEALNAKDSQLAVLRVRFEEADKELRAKKQIVEELQNEKSRILEDHTSVSGVQSQALESLKERLEEFQKENDWQKNEFLKKEKEYSGLIAKLEEQHQSISAALASAQKRLTEEQAQKSDSFSQLKNFKISLDNAKRELTEYKEKATRILQSKERLIESLKSGSGGESDIAASEISELKEEKEFLREELQQSRAAVETLRTEIQDSEVQYATDIEVVNEKLSHCREELDSEKRKCRELEHECSRQKQQLDLSGEELIKQKSSLQTRVREKENEVEKLRSQLLSRPAPNSNEAELENRLHALTESLIHKQTMVEALSTEKNSLSLQLERLEYQYKELQANNVRSSATINIMEDDDVRQRTPMFMRESPADGDVTRRVKRAANNIDRFSIRLGVFLRRYPIARVFVIIYMILLHLWVMVVLLTYQPEVHGKEFNGKMPAVHPPSDR